MRARAVAVLAVVVVTIAGCTSRVTGSALADPAYTPPPPKPLDSASELIGEYSTLDACSLLGEDALAQFGVVQKQNLESYDYCWVSLPVSGAKVTVRYGLLESLKSDVDMKAKQATEVEPVGPLRVFEEAPVPDRCARYVVFSDNISLAVSADSYDSPEAKVSSLCSIAEKATTAIAENVVSRKAGHRRFASSSLGPLDACKAATATSLAKVPGLSATQVTSYPAHHQCRWGSTTVPSVTLRYIIGEPSKTPETKQEAIAGKATAVYTVEIAGRSLCVAEVKQGDTPELAQVIVRLPPGGVDQACAAVRTVAGEVWAQLPS